MDYKFLMSAVSPWEVLELRRKIKGFTKRGLGESMKALHKLRSLGIDRQLILSTEVTRSLVWACNRSKDHGEDDALRKFNVMLRFLIKEYKKVLQLTEEKVVE